MTPFEALAGSLSHLGAHKLRSALTMLGVVFGVGAVIAMMSIGEGAERQALELIDQLGLRNLIVRAKQFDDEQRREIREKSLGLSMRDREAILTAVPGVEAVSPRVDIEAHTVLSSTGQLTEFNVRGVDADYFALTDIEIAIGRSLDRRDVLDHSQVAVVGPDAARELFGFEDPIGATFKINELWVTAVGVTLASGEVDDQEDSVEGVAVGSTRTAIFVPVSTALRKFNRNPLDAPLTEIVVRLADDSPIGAGAAARVTGTLLDQLHGGAEDYEMIVPEALLEQSRQTQRLFNVVMGCIAGISLVVGGIGIMNIMLASVLERTREIGVRRAVGAKRRDIVVQFLAESFTISALGGIAGIVMGVTLAQIIASSAGWRTVVTPFSVILATAVAVGVGIVSGLYPASRAAELDPIESLRYE